MISPLEFPPWINSGQWSTSVWKKFLRKFVIKSWPENEEEEEGRGEERIDSSCGLSVICTINPSYEAQGLTDIISIFYIWNLFFMNMNVFQKLTLLQIGRTVQTHGIVFLPYTFHLSTLQSSTFILLSLGRWKYSATRCYPPIVILVEEHEYKFYTVASWLVNLVRPHRLATKFLSIDNQ